MQVEQHDGPIGSAPLHVNFASGALAVGAGRLDLVDGLAVGPHIEHVVLALEHQGAGGGHVAMEVAVGVGGEAHQQVERAEVGLGAEHGHVELNGIVELRAALHVGPVHVSQVESSLKGHGPYRSKP